MPDLATNRKILLVGAGLCFLAFWCPWYRSQETSVAHRDTFRLGFPFSPWYRADSFQAHPGQKLRMADVYREVFPVGTPLYEDARAGDSGDSEPVPFTSAEFSQFNYVSWSSILLAGCLVFLVGSAVMRHRIRREHPPTRGMRAAPLSA